MKLHYLYILAGFLISTNIDIDNVYDDSWALIIGINNYDFIEDLNYSVDDASDIKNMLINDFDFPRENVVVLLDGDATLYKIRKEFSKIHKQVGENDRVVFYFAGHGETETIGRSENEKKEGYLMPADGNLAELDLTALPMTYLKREAERSRAKHMLFMVDACYGGLAAVNARGLTDINSPNYIDVISQDISRQIITAGQADQIVISKDEWENSAFTKNILSGLKKRQADRDLDGVITGSELGDYLIQTVMLDTENEQRPQSQRLTTDRGEMIFIAPIKQKKEKEETATLTKADLQAFVSALQKETKPVPKTYETVILPGFQGFYIENNTTLLIESVFYSPTGLMYRGKLQLNIGMSEDESWGPTVNIPIEKVLVIDGSQVGNFNYSTGQVE